MSETGGRRALTSSSSARGEEDSQSFVLSAQAMLLWNASTALGD